MTTDVLKLGEKLFIPGKALDQDTLKKALGELFVKPLEGNYRFTSAYGYRADPFTGVRSFHTGIDLAINTGTPIKASMQGKIATAGWNNVYGNYVIITHSNGYKTLYAHMQKYVVATGQSVNQGETIGYVGNTGYSTGPHLHFSVYKNNKLIDPLTVLK
jgi:murein DD-endopeptidase MepM/ murein hydrolase activator NlpD